MRIQLWLAVTVVILSLASCWWTTRRARQILGKSLGRPLREGEETSPASWMTVSSERLDAGTRQLRRDPFERLLKAMQDINPFGAL